MDAAKQQHVYSLALLTVANVDDVTQCSSVRHTLKNTAIRTTVPPINRSSHTTDNHLLLWLLSAFCDAAVVTGHDNDTESDTLSIAFLLSRSF